MPSCGLKHGMKPFKVFHGELKDFVHDAELIEAQQGDGFCQWPMEQESSVARVNLDVGVFSTGFCRQLTGGQSIANASFGHLCAPYAEVCNKAFSATWRAGADQNPVVFGHVGRKFVLRFFIPCRSKLQRLVHGFVDEFLLFSVARRCIICNLRACGTMDGSGGSSALPSLPVRYR